MSSIVEFRCPACNAVSFGTYRFCPDCGAPSPKFCQQCATTNSRDAKFCTECGSRFPAAEIGSGPERSSLARVPGSPDQRIAIAPEGERRQLTVLLADVTGYTAMNEKFDPESVSDVLDRLKLLATETVKRHGGIVNQFVGDEVVAIFGIGDNENAPQAAVQTALAIRDGVRKLSDELPSSFAGNMAMHFSICSGLLIIRPSDNREGIFSLTGDTINTASRLLNIAQTDEILIGPETQRAAHPYFVLERMGPVTLKGKAQSLVPFRVLNARPFQSSFQVRVAQGLTHFTGRTIELAQLQQIVERIRDGEGQVVVISGQAGLGKSRLVHELIRRLNGDDIVAHVSRCAPSTADTPYHPWIQVLRTILPLDSAGNATKLTDFAQAHGALARHLPVLLSLLGLESPEHALPPSIAQQLRPQMIWDAIAAVVRYAAMQQPTILLLEDWHWADKASDQCLRDLFRHLASMPSAGAGWPVMDNLTALSLRPLDRKGTDKIISGMFPNATIPESLVNMLFDRTSGYPLFIEEIVSYLREDGILIEREGVVTLTQPLASLTIPDSVQSAVLRRLDRIDPAWRELLRRAAVIGREFPLAVLQKLAPQGSDLEDVLDALLGMDLIVEFPSEGGAHYGFKHVITQDVAYDTLLHKQRRELHGAAARGIEEIYAARIEEHFDRLAFHYSRSDLAEKALEYLEKAGDRAASAFALDSARNQYAAAMQLLERPQYKEKRAHRIALSVKWSAASVFAADERHIGVMDRALAEAATIDAPDLMAKCHYWLGRMHYGGGNPTRAIENLEAALVLARQQDDAELAARCYCVVGRSSLHTAQVAHGLEYLTKGIAAMQQLGNSAEVAYSTASMGGIYALVGRFADAEQAFEDAARLARQQNNRTDEALVAQIASYARCLRGDWVSLGESVEQCVEISSRSGLPVLLAFGRIFQAYASAMTGDVSRGYRQMVEAISAHKSTGSKLAGSLCHGWCAEVCSLHGDLASAQRHADISVARAEVGDRFGQLPALRALARIAALHGKSDAARGHLNRAMETSEAWGALPDCGIIYLLAAELDPAAPSANTMRSNAARIFEQCQMPWWQERASH
jgi:class 3 adenylate cyclase/tetratricopeptide (TPR) repeat protein